jgi:hypothetical protein
LNRYSYALNNPVRFTDPTGHCLAALPFDTAGCVLSGPPGWVLLGGAAVVVVVVAAAGSNSAGATVESVGGAEGLPATSNSADTNDEIPTGPSGKLTRRDPGYWKRQGVDPEKLKDQVLHGSGSKYDVYTDKKGNVWILRKGETPDKAIWAGKLDDIVDDPDLRPDEQRDRRGGRHRPGEQEPE